jgi:CHAD domain-containing protein
MRLSSRTSTNGRRNGPLDSADVVADQREFLAHAEQLVRERFETLVAHYRPAVERPADDDEAVHQLRVSSRRLTAALQTLKPMFPARQRERLIRKLKAVRRAAGPARDLDVFRERVKSCEFPLKRKTRRRVLKFLKKRRKTAQKPLKKAFHTRAPQKLSRIVDGLLATTSQRAGAIVEMTPHLVEAAIARFRADVPAVYECAADLHQLRICDKRLRYTLETLLDLQAVPDSDGAGRLLDELKQIQDRLGKINDHAVSQRRLLAWAEETSRESLRNAFQQMAGYESAKADERTAEFFRWWSAERQQSFRRQLDELGS